MQFLNVTFHLQLLQNIGYGPHVIEYTFEPILHPIVYSSHSLIPTLPLPLFFQLYLYSYIVLFLNYLS